MTAEESRALLNAKHYIRHTLKRSAKTLSVETLHHTDAIRISVETGPEDRKPGQRIVVDVDRCSMESEMEDTIITQVS